MQEYLGVYKERDLHLEEYLAACLLSWILENVFMIDGASARAGGLAGWLALAGSGVRMLFEVKETNGLI